MPRLLTARSTTLKLYEFLSTFTTKEFMHGMSARFSGGHDQSLQCLLSYSRRCLCYSLYCDTAWALRQFLTLTAIKTGNATASIASAVHCAFLRPRATGGELPRT